MSKMRQADGRSCTTLLVLRPEDPISAHVHLYDDVAVLAIAGDLDGASATALKSAISGALAPNPQALVIDLSDVGFLGSVGISVLIEARQRVGGGERFAVVASGPMTGRTIQMLRLEGILAVHQSVGEALDAVRN